MRECPNCKKLLEDGTEICNVCGTAISAPASAPEAAAPVQETEPTAQAPAAEAEAPGQENPMNTLLAAVKKVPKKTWIIIGIAAAAVALIILLCCLLFGGKDLDYALYIKDDELIYSDLTGDSSFQVTDRLLDGIEDVNWVSDSYTISIYTALCDGGNRLFYPDRIEEDLEGATIYYRNPQKPDEDPVKLDSDIVTYAVNKKGNQAIYLKASKDLYLNDMEDKEKLASDVTNFAVTEDLKRIVYSNADGDLYLWNDGQEEKIVGEATDVCYINDSLTVMYYEKDGSLYKWSSKSGEKEKLDEDVYYIPHIYDSGEIYYLKQNEDEGSTVMDYVDDDLAEADAAMTEPVAPVYPSYPDYPDSPDRPYYWEYDTTEEYDVAYAQYEIDYAAYEAQYNQIKQAYEAAKDQYDADYDAYQLAREEWWDKESRDNLRESLAEYTLSSTGYTLYYYNGEAAVVAEDVAHLYFEAEADDAAVVVFEQHIREDIEKLKLSEIESAYSAYSQIQESLGTETVYKVAVGKELSDLDEKDAQYILLSDDGKTLYFLRDVTEDGKEGELCKASISGGKLGKTESYDTDVSTEQLYLRDNGLVYFKNYKSDDEEGDLFFNGKEIDYDVYVRSISSLDGGLLYYTDYDQEKSMGTLKLFKKDKSVKVSDDVYLAYVTADDDLLYIHDIGSKSKAGTLYRYNGGKPEKLDEDVAGFVRILSGRLKGFGAIYGW